jgi:hypothetical protein
VVGAGAGGGAALVAGAAVGGLLGGASVACRDGAAAAVMLALAVAWAAACGAGWAEDWALADADARARFGWARLDDADGVAAGGVVFAADAGVLSLAAVCAGAVRANNVAKPTAVTALSWVARQVRRDRRRNPAARAAPGGSSGNSVLSRMAGDHTRTRVKRS